MQYFFLKLRLTFCSYKKLAIFTTNIDAENQKLINHKSVCGALNRHFCQTRVMCCVYVFYILISRMSISLSTYFHSSVSLRDLTSSSNLSES